MKRLSLFAVLPLMFVFVFVFASAIFAGERMQINERGEIRNSFWRDLTAVEQAAVNNPGQEVPVDLQATGWERTDFFHAVPISSYTRVVVYENGILATRDKAGETRGQKELYNHRFWIILAIAMMVVSNLMIIWQGLKDAAAALTATAAAVAATVAAYAATAAATVVVVVAAAATVAAAAATVAAAVAVAVADDVKTYKEAVAVFYTLAALALIL
jgi:hypothetical protein